MVLDYLLEKYPVTVEELSDMLSLSEKKLRLILKKLEKRGILVLEPLPDKTYVRLLRRDIRFVGVNPSQKRALKRRRRRDKKKKEEDLDRLYV